MGDVESGSREYRTRAWSATETLKGALADYVPSSSRRKVPKQSRFKHFFGRAHIIATIFGLPGSQWTTRNAKLTDNMRKCRSQMTAWSVARHGWTKYNTDLSFQQNVSSRMKSNASIFILWKLLLPDGLFLLRCHVHCAPGPKWAAERSQRPSKSARCV